MEKRAGNTLKKSDVEEKGGNRREKKREQRIYERKEEERKKVLKERKKRRGGKERENRKKRSKNVNLQRAPFENVNDIHDAARSPPPWAQDTITVEYFTSNFL